METTTTQQEIRRLHTVCQSKDQAIRIAMNAMLELIEWANLDQTERIAYIDVVKRLNQKLS